MYYARPKKQAKNEDEPVPIKSLPIHEDTLDPADYSSDEENSMHPPLIKPLNTVPASALQSRGPNQLTDNIPAVNLTPEVAPDFYPVTNNANRTFVPGGLPEERVQAIAKWQEELADRKKRLKNHPMYQFAHLVAGNLHYQSLDPILEPITDYPIADFEMTVDGAVRKIVKHAQPEAERKASALFQDPLGNGLMQFSPAFTAALHGSYADLTSWLDKGDSKRNHRETERGGSLFQYKPVYDAKATLKPPRLEDLINHPGELRTQFARLVSRNMLVNMNLVRDGYHLEVDYDRVMVERDKLLGSIVRLLTGSKKRPYK